MPGRACGQKRRYATPPAWATSPRTGASGNTPGTSGTSNRFLSKRRKTPNDPAPLPPCSGLSVTALVRGHTGRGGGHRLRQGQGTRGKNDLCRRRAAKSRLRPGQRL